jgi:hypothetical protein
MAADAVMKLQRENRATVVSQTDVSNGSALMADCLRLSGRRIQDDLCAAQITGLRD